jgi:hypothetical protein
MTQTEAILAHLLSGKSITPLDALNEYGCFRLGARVLDLRKEGYNIETEIIHENGKHFARYWLAGKQEVTSDAYKVQTTMFPNDNQYNAA